MHFIFLSIILIAFGGSSVKEMLKMNRYQLDLITPVIEANAIYIRWACLLN